MSALEEPAQPRAVRVILREFIENVIEGEDNLDRNEIVKYALKRFERDEEFLAAAARDLVPVLVPEVLRAIVSQRREEFVQTPTGAVRRNKLEETARERLSKVFEATGKGYQSFLTLRKHNLLALNERDEKEISTRQSWVAFRTDLVKKMNDVKTVADSFTGVELDRAWRKHFEQPEPPTSA